MIHTSWLLVFCTIAVGGAAIAQQPEPGEQNADFALVEAHCTACHEIGLITSACKRPEQWSTTLVKMREMGAEFSEAERERILHYLITHNSSVGNGEGLRP